MTTAENIFHISYNKATWGAGSPVTTTLTDYVPGESSEEPPEDSSELISEDSSEGRSELSESQSSSSDDLSKPPAKIEDKSDGKKSPKTGDQGIMAYIIILALSGLALLVAGKRKRVR